MEQVKKLAWKSLKDHAATKYTVALTPVKRIDSGQADAVGGFVCELVSAPAFSDGRGMIINFTTGKTGTGGIGLATIAGTRSASP